MKIIIPGGSGNIGTLLARQFIADGHDVIVLSRKPSRSPWRTVQWDAKNGGTWQHEIEGADAVINLAGRSVNCRYNSFNREEIVKSRVNSTRAIGQAIASAKSPPKLWLQASTATIYAHRYDQPNDETTGIIGGDEVGFPETWRFSVDVAKSWEAAANEVNLPATRKVLMRAAMVMSPDKGSVFDVLLGLVRKGLGGTNGNGKQYVSWIHDQDFIRSVYWLINHQDIQGPINLASPNPLPNEEFMRTLRQTYGMPFGLPAAEWMLELGAQWLKTETELILKSRRVVPKKLIESGFEFEYGTWSHACQDLCERSWS